jgi:16S rRNA (adenine1518-N6/adenine1519-N6)-dimethyltransferase
MPIKPKLGQNFLEDDEAIRRIADSIGDLTGRTVVEIGPGGGAITSTLAERAARVLAVELDHDLAIRLRVRFPQERVSVIEEDVLQYDFAAASAVAGERLPVVGNLPYNITSPILLKLAASHASLDRAVLMVQREVADRVTAQPGSRDYGLLSVTVQMHGPPPPDVHSTVFRWRFAPRFEELGVEEVAFLRFVRQCFAQKRKTLANNLRAAGIPPAEGSEALAQAGIAPQARAEVVPIEGLAALWRALETKRAVSPDEAAPSVESA